MRRLITDLFVGWADDGAQLVKYEGLKLYVNGIIQARRTLNIFWAGLFFMGNFAFGFAAAIIGASVLFFAKDSGGEIIKSVATVIMLSGICLASLGGLLFCAVNSEKNWIEIFRVDDLISRLRAQKSRGSSYIRSGQSIPSNERPNFRTD